MKNKIFKISGVIVLCLLLLIGGLFIYGYSTQPISVYDIKNFEEDGNIVANNILTEDEVKEDIESIIEIMETTHPIFLEEVPEKYYTLKYELLSNSNKSMTAGELRSIISKYLSSIDDGHTSIRWNEDILLDVNWKYNDGKLVLLDKNKKLTNNLVTKIGDMDIDIIIKFIQDTFPNENYVAESMNIEKYSKGKVLLESVGVNFEEEIILTVQNNDKVEDLPVDITREDKYKNLDYSIYSNKIDNDTAYIRLETCEVNDSLEKVVQDIAKYISEGTINFIIDVSDNSGGNSEASTMILEALKLKVGDYGSVIRFSPLAQEQRGYLRKSGNITFKSNNEAVGNNDINLYVLTNEKTFSSAQMLAVWVSDGGLGTLVGRPSSNMPSSFGDVLNFQLKNSKIVGRISYKKWTRPDIEKSNERVLEPDIYVDYGDDLLEKALEEIKNNN